MVGSLHPVCFHSNLIAVNLSMIRCCIFLLQIKSTDRRQSRFFCSTEAVSSGVDKRPQKTNLNTDSSKATPNKRRYARNINATTICNCGCAYSDHHKVGFCYTNRKESYNGDKKDKHRYSNKSLAFNE